MPDDKQQPTWNEDLQRQIDRLVDGELSQAEQQQLLGQLEQQPGAWRRCALAFLEAQAWSSDLASLSPASGVSPQIVSRTESRARLLSWAGSLVLASAAGVLLALGVAQFLEPSGDSPVESVVAGEENHLPTDASNRGVLAVGDNTSRPLPVGDATFFVTTGSQEQAFELPVYAASELSDDWQTTGSELPVELVETLDRTGRRWTRSRELIPVQLEDGGQVIVPVNQISFESPVVYQ